jgi:hypothetical protein
MSHIWSSPPSLASFVVSCAILVPSDKSLLSRHDERGVVKKQKVPFSVAQNVRFLVPLLKKIC